MHVSEVKCVAPVGDICGEAVTWCESKQGLYWVDINRFLIHFFQLEKQSVQTWIFNEPVVALSLTSKPDKLLVALASKIIIWSSDDNSFEDLGFSTPDYPKVRLNDGCSDPKGNFWVGSMQNNVGPQGEDLGVSENLGSLFRVEKNGAHTIYAKNIGISNTVCWSPDQQTFYFGDTLKNEILAFDYDHKEGNISNPRSFFSGFERGVPDGSAVDSEGFLWNCRFDGGCIVRVAPDGSVDQVVEMPVKNITTCTFGGAGLKSLYITTASTMSSGTGQYAGSLFKIDLPIAGLSEKYFMLD